MPPPSLQPNDITLEDCTDWSIWTTETASTPQQRGGGFGGDGDGGGDGGGGDGVDGVGSGDGGGGRGKVKRMFPAHSQMPLQCL